jgi:short-subunit dehydrogenase
MATSSTNGTSSNRLLVVFGSGPGIGNAVTSLFVAKRYSKVALLARSEMNLKQSKEVVEAYARDHGRSVEIKTWAVDLANTKALEAVLPEIEQFGELECVFYNCARVRQTFFFEETEDEMRYDYDVSKRRLSVGLACIKDARSPSSVCTLWLDGQSQSCKSWRLHRQMLFLPS